MKTLLISILIIGLGIFGMCFNIIFRKNGEFPETEISRNKEMRKLGIHDLRQLIGNVNQEAILFNDSFIGNITFGVENATQEQVEQAARIANAHDFIMQTEHGYDTNIGDRGGRLSGGQRQRVSIARAILKNPPILILDEATSALDTESERLVQDALERLMTSRTTVAIAHRLSTIKNANEICVLHPRDYSLRKILADGHRRSRDSPRRTGKRI